MRCHPHKLVTSIVTVVLLSLWSSSLSGQVVNPLRPGGGNGAATAPPLLGTPAVPLQGELVDLSEVRRATFEGPALNSQPTPVGAGLGPLLTQPIVQETGEPAEIEVLPEGENGAPPASEGVLIGADQIYGEDCGICGGISGRLGICADGCLIPCPQVQWEKFQFFAGVAGFTGPANRGSHSSFGFSEGFNWGTGFAARPKISGQIGYRAIQSTFSGTEFTDLDRKQSFITAGVFRRADWGWQGGIVMDYMHDDWYYDIDLIQLRAEISWKFPQGDELGFWLTRKSDGSTSESALGKPAATNSVESWELTDVYAFFFRRQVVPGGEFRAMGGFTSGKDGLIGADATIPLNERLALQLNFTYLIPQQSSMTTGHEEEGWNVGFNLVFYPGCNTPFNIDYNRPLFSVADNGTMFLSRLP